MNETYVNEHAPLRARWIGSGKAAFSPQPENGYLKWKKRRANFQRFFIELPALMART